MKQWSWFQELNPLARKRWVAFALYCWFTAAIFLGIVIIGILNAFVPAVDVRLGTNLMFMSSGVMIFWFLPLFALFFIAPLLPKQSWAWRFNMMVLCLGIATLFLLPVAVIMVAFWLSEDLQRAYGVESMSPDKVRPPRGEARYA